MIKLVFFVHCKSWKNGGYENTHYFQTENEARSWAKTENQRLQKISGEYGIEVRSIEAVSQEEFSEDFMGGRY